MLEQQPHANKTLGAALSEFMQAQGKFRDSLEDLTDMVAGAGLQSPTLIIIGNVVTLSPSWRDQREKTSEARGDREEHEGTQRELGTQTI